MNGKELELERFIAKYEDVIVPLFKAASAAYFDASISGKREDYEKAGQFQTEITNVHASKSDFEKLKDFRESTEISDEILNRQLTILYNSFAGYQYDENLRHEIINDSVKIEECFATFRAEVKGKKVTDNEVEKVLSESTNNNELETYWDASKKIGGLVADDVIALVKKRNKAANQLGYDNYYQMSLELSEQKEEELDKIFEDLDNLSRDKFAELKIEMDNFLSHKYKVDKTDLMPWHYQDRFFQHAPKIHKVDLDKYYLDQNIEVITKNYFNGIGLEIDDLLERSDLYEKEGKYQHAYCTNIDKSGDVRVVCNIKPNHDWMGTMLHEFGHAVYDKYVNDRLPWILREHSHIFTTEAIAMIFGRFASSPQWIDDMIGIGDDEKNEIADECKKSARLEQFVFARWVLVIYNFEKEMYRNPDQDLNALWWEKVEKFQFLKRPIGRNKADWASKIHLALYPAYYHNYLLGEMLASQLYYFISEKVLGKSFKDDLSFAGNKKVGDYLKMLFFNYGALYRWDELVNKSTGEDLNPKYYAEQFFH